MHDPEALRPSTSASMPIKNTGPSSTSDDCHSPFTSVGLRGSGPTGKKPPHIWRRLWKRMRGHAPYPNSENKCVLINKSLTSSPKRALLKDKIPSMRTIPLGRHT
ncbi:hypothetical protein Taro_033729 [Colocasia esculenta]|uniref:Uncharacterized protein n=1 Tax=Colocasia esculenta TaxID=4460 RepID=A0A843VVZ5_COLES|nr:hypothetical protein [Colocasia esculenta]